MLFVLILFTQNKLPAIGWVPASTPQAWRPVLIKPIASTPTPTPTPRATETPSPENWLDYINWLRALGGLPAVTENTSWSLGCTHHAKYMVKNNYIGHSEDPANPWYTDDGNAAAGSGNAMVSSNVNATDIYAIDLWMSGPFHGLGIIDPALGVSGFGSYREADGGWQMAACLDVIRGLGAIAPSVTFPVMWPANGSTIPFDGFYGGEWPDPLTSCSGYLSPSGPPIFLQIGPGNQTPNVTSHTIKQGSTTLENCEFDETNYANPDSSAQSLGRNILGMRDAIVLMPKNPLTSGMTYTISIINSGTTYTWSITVSSAQLIRQPDAHIR